MFDILPDEEITEIIKPVRLSVHHRMIAKAEQKHTLERVIERGNEDCPHRTLADPDGEGDVSLRTKKKCLECWADLEKEAGK